MHQIPLDTTPPEEVENKLMSTKKFTPQAELLWGSIPARVKDKILQNGFCTKCSDSVPIIDYGGKEVGGDLVLHGRCGNCGTKVIRVVETSEMSFEKN